MTAKLTSIDVFQVKDRGTVYAVKAPCAFERSLTGLIAAFGDPLEIDGKIFKPVGMESYALGTPVRAGETIGILVWDNVKE